MNRIAGELTFYDSWGLGIEGNSKAATLPVMNPHLGGKSEYLWLFGLIGASLLIVGGRRSNEEGLRNQIVATNTYARLGNVAPSSWDA